MLAGKSRFRHKRVDQSEPPAADSIMLRRRAEENLWPDGEQLVSTFRSVRAVQSPGSGSSRLGWLWEETERPLT